MNFTSARILPSIDCSHTMEEDASAWGVAHAFTSAAAELETALVSWCNDVGEAITSPELSSSSPTSFLAPTFLFLSRNNSGATIGSTAKRVTAVSDDGHGQPLRSSSKHNISSGNSVPSKLWRRGSLPASSSSINTAKDAPSKLKPLKLQDIVIMPTQRVARYVMLYRGNYLSIFHAYAITSNRCTMPLDLLKHVPTTSPTHALVNEALQTALRIAQRCNDAQDNLLPPPPHRPF
jgi:hypothetical protein